MKNYIVRAAVLLVLASPAFAQTGDGKPVSPSPFVEVHIDEVNGCKTPGGIYVAEKFCSDYDVATTFKGDTTIQAAKSTCVGFYRVALRLQNIFCSYSTDVALFRRSSQVKAQAERVGNANVSQHAVAGDNRNVAGINKKYMDRIAAVGSEFHKIYPQYLQAIAQISAKGGSDQVREANCLGLTAPTNLNLNSAAPGTLRVLLAGTNHATAQVTHKHMWDSVRHNYAELKKVKEEAQENAQKSEMRELQVGGNFEAEMKRESAAADATVPMSPSEGAISGGVQDLLTRGIRAKFPNLAPPFASIIGGGMILVWQYSSNKRIMYPEAAATFIGMFNPYAGMAANILVGAYRTSEGRTAEYATFAHGELKKNVNATSAQIVDAWGKLKKNDVCVKSAQMAANCIAVRPGLPAYSGSNCALQR